MRKHNPENERVKREYLTWLRNAGGRNEATLDIVAAGLDRFEAHTNRRPFKAFRREQAVSFKTHLAAQKHPRTGKPLAKATLYSTLRTLKAFFEWLAREPGYRSHVTVSDAAYFNPTENDARVATAAREKTAPSLEQVLHVLDAMPEATVIERRDRAVVAFILLTGARDTAATSFRLKHVDLAARTVAQDAREVRTKGAKTFTTAFFPVGEAPERIVRAWIEELKAGPLLFGPDEPLFPATVMGLNERGLFAPVSIAREPWAGAGPVRVIFRRAFEAAGLPYAHPHSLRRTLMRLAYDLQLAPRELKAWSQNLGHESVLTSLGSYGALALHEQVEVMSAVGSRQDDPTADPPELAAALAAMRKAFKRAA